jgi:hypothetical protein
MIKQEAMKPGEKVRLMALWLSNQFPAFLQVSWFPAQNFDFCSQGFVIQGF